MQAAAITVDDVLRAGRLLFGPQFEAHGDWRAGLKRAFHRRALETHPDRAATLGRAAGELAREFQAVTEAFHTLSAFRAAPRPPHRHEPRPTAAARPPPPPPAPERRQTPPPPPPRARRAGPSRATPPAPADAAHPRAQPAPPKAAPPPPPRAAPDGPSARAAAPQPPPRDVAQPHDGRERASTRAAAPPPEQPAAAPPADAPRARAPREPRAARHETRAADEAPRPAPSRPEVPRWQAWPAFPRRQLRFAEYLYYAGRVAFADVVQAVVWQRRQRPNLGDIAVAFGYLTPAQVSEILERRRHEAPVGTLFAEFAVEAGFLTRYQQLVIVGHQKGQQRKIGDFFVERGLIQPDEIPEIRRRIILHNATCLDLRA